MSDKIVFEDNSTQVFYDTRTAIVSFWDKEKASMVMIELSDLHRATAKILRLRNGISETKGDNGSFA